MANSPRRKAAAPSFGYCNICNELRELTRDHVPPKGSIDLKPVEVKNFAQWLAARAPGRVNGAGDPAPWENVGVRYKLAQSGVNFRSICADCNNVKLGSRYDLELNRVSQTMTSLVRMQQRALITLPWEVQINVRTHFLMRGIIGHLLAAHVTKDRAQPLPELNYEFYADLRRYFLDERLPLPDSTRIWCWPYLAKEQVIITGLTIFLPSGGGSIFGDLIKFFPIAYYVATTLNTQLELPLSSFRGHGCADLSCEIPLCLRLDHVPLPEWPEMPTRHHSVILPLEHSHFSAAPNRPPRRLPPVWPWRRCHPTHPPGGQDGDQD